MSLERMLRSNISSVGFHFVGNPVLLTALGPLPATGPGEAGEWIKRHYRFTGEAAKEGDFHLALTMDARKNADKIIFQIYSGNPQVAKLHDFNQAAVMIASFDIVLQDIFDAKTWEEYSKDDELPTFMQVEINGHEAYNSELAQMGMKLCDVLKDNHLDDVFKHGRHSIMAENLIVLYLDYKKMSHGYTLMQEALDLSPDRPRPKLVLPT